MSSSICALLFLTLTTEVCFGDMISPSYYCAEMGPQHQVNIAQMMGMWYGIEILSHKQDEPHQVRVDAACPIIYISEDKTITTPTPLHKDYNYGYNYGTGYEVNYQGQYSYETSTTRRYDNNYGSHNRRYNTNYNRKKLLQQMQVKRIKLLWDENGTEILYNLRYNVSTPGFWISSGPQNGSELEEPFQHFAGTVQVIKAVGSHLVLTFCHQLPERQLFTVLLSRETKLESHEIHGVHNLLLRKGLGTSNVRKVCSNGTGPARTPAITAILMTLIWTLFRHFRINNE